MLDWSYICFVCVQQHTSWANWDRTYKWQQYEFIELNSKASSFHGSIKGAHIVWPLAMSSISMNRNNITFNLETYFRQKPRVFLALYETYPSILLWFYSPNDHVGRERPPGAFYPNKWNFLSNVLMGVRSQGDGTWNTKSEKYRQEHYHNGIYKQYSW